MPGWEQHGTTVTHDDGHRRSCQQSREAESEAKRSEPRDADQNLAGELFIQWEILNLVPSWASVNVEV